MYIYYNPNPNSSASKKNDCVVRAISRVLNKRWTRVYDELSSLGRRLGDWGCYFTVWGPYLRDHGFKKYVIPNYCPDCYTMGRFADGDPAMESRIKEIMRNTTDERTKEELRRMLDR